MENILLGIMATILAAMNGSLGVILILYFYAQKRNFEKPVIVYLQKIIDTFSAISLLLSTILSVYCLYLLTL